MQARLTNNIFIVLLILIAILLSVVSSFAEPITYSYDDANRLILENRNGVIIEYIYDQVGNLLQKKLHNISVVPRSHNFGLLKVGESASQTFTVSSTGSETIMVSAVGLTGDVFSCVDCPDPAPFSIVGDTCTGNIISSSQSCNIQIVFSPSTIEQSIINASLVITFDSPNSFTVAIPLTGTVDDRRQLTVTVTGDGSVTSSPSGIDCGDICSYLFNNESLVILTANPDANSTLLGWTGCNAVDGNDCLVLMDTDRDITAEFSTEAVSPTTMWGDTVPQAQANNGGEVELGVKFRTSVDGAITGIRFYKVAGDTGTHTAHLWDRNGNLLASATFTDETSGGWQEVDFTAPVAVSADTTYIASYHTNMFMYTLEYFTAAVTNGALRFLANGEDGGNGVYLYGPVSFPVNTYYSANYWVDVAFEAGTAP